MELLHWMLVFVRVSALLVAFPLFSMATMPVMIRTGLAALTAFLIAPTVQVVPIASLNFGGLIGLLAMEVVIGVVMGLVGRMIFFALQTASDIVSTEIGLNLAAVFNPLSATQSQAPGLILFLLGTTLFFSLDMHHWVLLSVQRSYEFLPAGGARITEPFAWEIVKASGQTFTLGLTMAAPIIATSFVVSLIFAVLGRAVPQMSVFNESFAFRVLAGLIVFGLSLNVIGQHAANSLQRLPEDMLRAVRLLGGGG